MSFVSHLKAAAALGALTVMMPAPATAQALSAAVGKPLQAAGNALRARNTAAAISQVKIARAAARTPAEKAKVGQMAAAAYTAARQYGQAAQELESLGAPARQLAPVYYQGGMYDKAIATAKRAGGADMGTIVAQSYIKKGNYAQASATYQQLIKQYGPQEKLLSNLAGAQYKSGDKKAYLATTERLIRVDPSPARWNALLVDLKNGQMSREAKLGLYELMRQTGNLKQAADYQDYAKLAIVANQPGTAKAALEQGRASKAISAGDSMTDRLIQASGERAAQAQAGLAKLPATPAGQLQAANIYFGMGDYAKAASAFARATPSDATKLQLGIAQLKAGQTAVARNTFKSIPPTSQVSDIASLWSLYASTRG